MKIPSHIPTPPKDFQARLSSDPRDNRSAGKGSAPRNIFSEAYRKNYDDIFRKPVTPATPISREDNK